MASNPHHGFATLSTRQRQVAALIALGHRNKYIAQQLNISEGTVKLHAHAIFQKLGVRTRYHQVRRTRRLSPRRSAPLERQVTR